MDSKKSGVKNDLFMFGSIDNGVTMFTRIRLKTAEVTFALLFSIAASIGAPHEGEQFSLRQPDGTFVPVLVWGDEFHQNVESPDGYTLIRDKDEWICYAVLSADGNEYISSGIRYTSDRRTPSLSKRIRINRESMQKKQLAKKKALGYQQLIEPNPALPHIYSPSPQDEGGEPAEPKMVTGLTVLIDFPDTKSNITREMIENFCNQPGYSKNNNNGSVFDYFRDVSNGQMLYTNVVTTFITASNNKSYYDRGEGYNYVQELLTDVLGKLKNQGIDMSQITLSNNRVLALNVFYAGSANAGWANGLWPHAGTYQGRATINGIGFSKYQLASLGSSPQLGTFVHENGHMLMSWPDLYSYEDHSNGVGNWCVMNSINPATNPQQPNPYFRNLAGWISVTNITGRARGTVYTHTANSHSAYTYIRNSKEFYFIEARKREGRSSGLPGDGLLVWHVHTDGRNTDPRKGFPLVALVQADGKRDLEKMTNNGDAGDPFRTNYNTRFNKSTIPASIWHDAVSTGIDLAEISSNGPEMTFTIGPDAEVINYTLAVINGNGSGSYPMGQSVEVRAEAKEGSFLRWSSSSQPVDQPYSAVSSITMDSADVTITAHFCDLQSLPGGIEAESAGYLQGITAVNCYDEGGGKNLLIRETDVFAEYLVKAQTAGTYEFSFRLSSTEGGRLVLRDITNNKVLDTIDFLQTGSTQSWQSIKGRQIDLDTSVAVWRIESVSGTCNLNRFSVNATCSLQVVNGSGSGVYASGTVVRIEADSPPDNWKYFAGWIADSASLSAVSDSSQSITTVTVGDVPIILTATYADSPTVGIIMPAGTGNTVTVNDTFFYDDGGNYYGYSRIFSGDVTFIPAVKEFGVVMSFEMIDLSSPGNGAADSLIVYAGSGESRVLLEVIKGSEVPKQIRSTSPDGRITVHFVSNGVDTGAGWKIHLTTEALLSTSHLNRIPHTFGFSAGPNGIVNFQLPQSEHVKVTMYDMRGRLVAVLFEGKKFPGYYRLGVSGAEGSKLSRGFYAATVIAGSYRKSIQV